MVSPTVLAPLIPDMNSFGICFLPDVVTRYRVKSSILKTTQEVISFFRLSSTSRLAGESGIAPALCSDELLLPEWGIAVGGFEEIVDPLLLPGGVCGGVDGTFDDLRLRIKLSKICLKFEFQCLPFEWGVRWRSIGLAQV